MADLTTGSTYVDAPTLEQTPNGIFSAAEVKKFADKHEAMGVIYESEACAPGALLPLDLVTCFETSAMETEGFAFTDGLPFYIYAGTSCNLFGGYDRAERAALRRLNAGAERLVERNIWELIFPGSDTVDITPAGGAVSPKIALGLLEEYAGAHYDSIATVHFGRRLGVELASANLIKTDTSKTISGGSKFVNGSGYTSLDGPGQVTAGDGEVWMYVTGQIVLRHGDPTTFEAQAPQTNDLIAFAQDTYVPTIDCFTAAIRVSLE